MRWAIESNLPQRPRKKLLGQSTSDRYRLQGPALSLVAPATMAMQALITREGAPADMVAKPAVEYAEALIEALAAIAPNPPDLRPGF